jgi:hypothetical protein
MKSYLITFVVLLIINIPVYLLIGKLLFRNWENFWDAFDWLSIPNFLTLFDKEYWIDWWAHFRLVIFLISCLGCVLGELYLLDKFILHFGNR